MALGHSARKQFRDIKKMCVSAPVFAYYDKKKAIVLTVDSCSKGLGAAVMQEGKMVAYASSA